MTPAGLPHSDILGSTVVCASPRLIAAYHVLHRLLAPRHPPYALSSLTGKTRHYPWCLTNLLRANHGPEGPSSRSPDSLFFSCQRSMRPTVHQEGRA
jgi:hypothetical protein